MSRPVVGYLLIVLAFACASRVVAQDRVRVSGSALIFLLPDAKRVPLQQATAGMSVEVIGTQGSLLNVSWEDARFGRRTGYIESRFVTRPVPSAPRRRETRQ